MFRWTPRAPIALLCTLLLLLTTLSGCQREPAQEASPSPLPPGLKLRLAVAGIDPDQTQAALRWLQTETGEWSSTRQAEVEMLPQPQNPSSLEKNLDVILFPGDLMGDLMDQAAPPGSLAEIKLSAPVPPSDLPPGQADQNQPPPDPYNFADILPEVRDRVIRYGGTIHALPLGTSGLVLAYRRDAMERVENRAEAAKQGITLEPPATYTQLDALARFFNGRDWNGDGANEAGIALALGPDPEGLADAIFLSRAAALGQHPDYYGFLFDERTMAPRIASAPFVQALEETIALAKLGPEGAAGFSADYARAAFREGKAALLIDRAEMAGHWSDRQKPVPTGVSRLPGSSRVYDPARETWENIDPPNQPHFIPYGGGWMIGVLDRQRQSDLRGAIDFAKSLSSPDSTNRLTRDTLFPVLPARLTQLAVDPLDPRLDIRGWSRAVADSLTAARIALSPRLPGARLYMADLARAREAAARGELSAANALSAAAAAWAKRTEEVGVDYLRWHYRQSLNLRVIGSAPPKKDPTQVKAPAP